jgi:predicted ester cyclase
LDLTDCRVDRIVTSGSRAAFHATVVGRYRGGLPGAEGHGRTVEGHLGAFATVTDSRVASLTGVTNRVTVQRQLRAHPHG